MKISEQAVLLDYCKNLNEFLKNNSFNVEKLKNLSDFSMQKVSYKQDMDFMAEVKKILSVIISIISHPHISSRREDVVIRVEQAKQIPQDSLSRVFKDSSLWREHNGKMMPEEVYFYQHEDQLIIYENRFIVLCIDTIFAELKKISSFYLSRLSVLNEDEQSEKIELAVKNADLLLRKVRFLKNTYFYKIVSKAKKLVGAITPTNILIKDRLYRECFRFMRRFIRYESVLSYKEDLARYYSVVIFNAFNSLDFKRLQSDEKISKKIAESGDNGLIAPLFHMNELEFFKDDIKIKLSYQSENAGFLLKVKHKNSPKEFCHLIVFSDEEENEQTEVDKSNLTSCFLLSVWNLFDYDGEIPQKIEGNFSATEMFEKIILSVSQSFYGDKDIYSKYCPCCKTLGVEEQDGVICCPTCHCQYVFAGEKNGKTNIFIGKLRRL